MPDQASTFDLLSGVIQQDVAIFRYPTLTWSEIQMWQVMKYCVIMHNIFIESEQESPVVDDHEFDHQGLLAQVD
jgi:hypothetical protein